MLLEGSKWFDKASKGIKGYQRVLKGIEGHHGLPEGFIGVRGCRGVYGGSPYNNYQLLIRYKI